MVGYEAVFDAMWDAIFIVDANTGMVVDANRAAENLCGRTLKELLTLNFAQLGPCEREKEGSVPYAIDRQIIGLSAGLILRKDGDRIPVEIAGSHLTRPDGTILLVRVVRRLTERNAPEEPLRRSEERFRQAAESAREFIWEVNADGLYIYVSSAVEHVLGYKPEELVGKMHPYDLLVPENREAMTAAAHAIMAQREPLKAFLSWRARKDGKAVALETSGMPFRDSSGVFLGYLGCTRDVTERELAYEAVLQSERI